MSWTTSSTSSPLTSVSALCWLVYFFAASPVQCSQATSDANEVRCNYSAADLAFGYRLISRTVKDTVLDVQEAVNTTAERMTELLVALKRDGEGLRTASDQVQCYSGSSSELCQLMPDPFCDMARSCGLRYREVSTGIDKVLETCAVGASTFRVKDKPMPSSLPPTSSFCLKTLESLLTPLKELGKCSSLCGSFISNNTNYFSNRFGGDMSESFRNFTAYLSTIGAEFGALIRDFRSGLDSMMVWLELVRPARPPDAPFESWQFPTGGEFLRTLLSRAFYFLTLLYAPSGLTMASHLAVSSFWIFVPHALGSFAQGSPRPILRFASYLPRLFSGIAVLKFVISLGTYDRGLDAAVILSSVICTALHSRIAFQGASGGRTHTYRPFDWAFSVYVNGIVMTGFGGENLGELMSSGLLIGILFIYASINFVVQSASLREYLHASVMLNSLVAGVPVAIALYLGVEEWFRTCSSADFLLATSPFFWAWKASLPYVVRFATFIVTGPSALMSWSEVAHLVSGTMEEPSTRADRDLQTAVLVTASFAGGTALFALRIVSSYVFGREILCRWERRRGSRPVPPAAAEAYADHFAYVLLGLCPMFHRLCPGLSFSFLEIIKEMYNLNVRQSNVVSMALSLLSLALFSSDVFYLLALEMLAFSLYSIVVGYYEMAPAFRTSRGIDAELAQTSAAIDRLPVSPQEKEFLKTASQVQYGSDAKRYCSAMPSEATPLASLLVSSYDWEGQFGHDEGKVFSFNGLASGTLVSDGDRIAILTVQHCAVSGPKSAFVHGNSVHVPHELSIAPAGLGDDPARACALLKCSGLHFAMTPLLFRDPIVGEDCVFLGARSLSWGKVSSVTGMTAQTEQNPMPGYSGRLCVAVKDCRVIGFVSMRTMFGDPRTGHIVLVDAALVNQDAGFEVFRACPKPGSTSLPDKDSFVNTVTRSERLCQEVSAQKPQAPQTRTLCQHFLRNDCAFGSNCRNVHLSPEDFNKIRDHLREPDLEEELVNGDSELSGEYGDMILDALKKMREENVATRAELLLRTRSHYEPPLPAEVDPDPPAPSIVEVEVPEPVQVPVSADPPAGTGGKSTARSRRKKETK